MKLFKQLIAGLMLAMMIATPVMAQEIIPEADAQVYVSMDETDELTGLNLPVDIGSGMSISLNSLGKLTISGTGKIKDFSASPFSAYISKIKEIEISDGITYIGEHVFEGCTQLMSVHIPGSVVGIGTCAFTDCTALTNVKIDDGLKWGGYYVFGGCTSLSEITLPYTILKDRYEGESRFVGGITDNFVPTTTVIKGYSNTGAEIAAKAGGMPFVSLGTAYIIEFEHTGFSWPDNMKSYKAGAKVGNLPTLTKEGYKFKSWCYYDDNNNRHVVTADTVLSGLPFRDANMYGGDISVYAEWTPIYCNVTLDPEGGTVSPTSLKLETGKPFVSLPTPVKAGYTFDGWTDASNVWINNEVMVPEVDTITLFAKWVKNTDPDANDVTKKFSDVVAGKWYVNAVQYVVDNGIMAGTGPLVFEPETPCSRSMMVTILYSIAGKPAVSGSTQFTDLRSNWYKMPVLWAFKNDITSGQSATLFASDKNVSRQEMAVFLNKFAKYKNADISARTDLNKFVDLKDLSSWAVEQMKWAHANGIINGKGGSRLDPKGDATRAEVAAMIMSFCNKFGK